MIYVYKNINFLWTHKYCILTIKNPAVLFYCNNHVHGERGRRETVQLREREFKFNHCSTWIICFYLILILNIVESLMKKFLIICQLTLDHCDILFFTRQLWNIFNEICIDIENSNEKCGEKNPKTWNSMLYTRMHVLGDRISQTLLSK